jgi:hypothetical protein
MTAISKTDWVELDEKQKDAATLLGFTEALWDGNGSIPLEEKDWEELTDEQKVAAEILELDEDEWDDEGTSIIDQ